VTTNTRALAIGCIALATFACGGGGEGSGGTTLVATPIFHTSSFAFDGELLLSLDFDDFTATAYDARGDGSGTTLLRPAGQSEVMAAGGIGLYVVEEFAVQTDLNGDGEIGDDFVPQLVDREGNLYNFGLDRLGVAMSPDGNLIAVLAGEQGNLDYNGDGDQLDVWPFLQQGGPDQTPVRIEIQSGSAMRAEGDFLLIGASELRCNEDLNGDGDIEDRVLHVYHAPTQTLVNVGKFVIDLPSSRVDGTRIFFRGDEGRDDVDENGDGDKTDAFVFIYDFASDSLTPTTLDTSAWSFDGRFLWAIELEDEVDRNGNGRLEDFIFRSHDTETGVERLVDSAVWNYDARNGTVIYTRIELLNGDDLNGDGDTDDDELYLMEAPSGPPQRIFTDPSGFPRLTATHAIWTMDEDVEGVDRNGDGDLADHHLFLHDLSEGSTLEFDRPGLEPLPFAANESAIAFLVEETDEDLNGDDDLEDRVAHVFSFVNERTYNLGLATPTVLSNYLRDDRLALPVREFEQDRDLNGDGDQDDFVIHLVELPGSTP